MTKFTPGPWKWHIEDHSMGCLSGPDEMRDHVLCVSPCKNCQKEGESPFNRCTSVYHKDMNLIAAAPDMYEALSWISGFTHVPENDVEREIHNKAQKALAKARGESDV